MSIAEKLVTIAENQQAVYDAGYLRGKEDGGGVPAEEKDVNFYDYDGTLLYSYSLEEVQALTELPPLPKQQGLICQEWNWDLADLKALGRKMDVGATYITDDGATRLYLNFPSPGRLTVPLNFIQTVSNGVTIDWGDGTAVETISGTGDVSTSHTYANEGVYKISLLPKDGCAMALGNDGTGTRVFGTDATTVNFLYRVEIGKNVTSLRANSFNGYRTERITIPNGVKSMGSAAFIYNNFIQAVILPKTMTTLSGTEHFYNANKLNLVSVPNGVTTAPAYFIGSTKMRKFCAPDTVTKYGNGFAKDSTVMYLGISKNVTAISTEFANNARVIAWKIPSSVQTIGANSFASNKIAKIFDFTEHTAVPTLENVNAFSGILADCEIRVPAALRDEWAAATNWSTYASQIVGV